MIASAPRRPAVSLVVVAHRSATCLPAAVASFRREAHAMSLTAEVVIVEQSEDDDERQRVEACSPERLLVLENRGFAAGVNAGVEAARGELLVIANPDVELLEGSLAQLVGALDSGWQVVGPQFVLGDFLLPPADVQTPLAEGVRQAASRWPGFGKRVLARQARRWLRLWTADEPCSVRTLSGGLLAYRRSTAQRVGPWDEDYFLYFEETDWLRRAEQAGAQLALVPGARVTHNWGHSADERSTGHFVRSRLRFYRRNHPALGFLAARWTPAARPVDLNPLTPAVLARIPASAWWLLALSPHGLPAAGTLCGSPRLPGAVLDFLALRPSFPAPVLIAFEPEQRRVLGRWRWVGAESER